MTLSDPFYLSATETSTSTNDELFKSFVPSIMLPIFLMVFAPSSLLIGQHIFNYKQEFIQKFYVRILLMVPVNAVVSYCQLFVSYRYIVFLQIIRDCYEVYVVLSFYYLLLSSSGEAPCLTRCVAHLIPRVNRLCCCNVPVPGMKKMLLITRICVMQFAIQKPFLSIFKAIMVQFGFLLEGPFKVVFRLYGLFIMFVALWVLLFFFRVISKTVVAVRPVQIFLWIKVAMFLNLLQEFIIGMILQNNESAFGFIHKFSGLELDEADYESRVSAILFLFEMIYLNCVSPIVFPLKSANVVQIKEVALYLDKKKEGRGERTYWGNILFALKDILIFWNFKGMGCPHGISIENYSNNLFDN
ncbi:Transmembrane protein [Entamoeba marina]